MKIRFLYVVFALSILLIGIGAQTSFAQTTTPPEPITDLVSISGNEEIRLFWTAPDNFGGPITSYKVVIWKTGSDVTTTYPNLSTSTSAIITGLTNGVSYSAKVFAVNSAGTSTDSNIITVKPMAEISLSLVPSKINSLVATRDDGKVNL